eukprot:evm.model.scf_1745.1 EVM.evm.TU.scf_1745.1   scf_1745:1835-16747(+)
MASLFRHFYPEDGAALFASFTGGLRYNQKSLAHLKRQLEKIDSCDGVSQLLTDAQTADEGTARRTAYEALATAVCQGKALITCHTQALNVNKFYTVGEVELIMKEVFGALRLFLKEGGLQTLDLSDRVPQQDVCHDRRMLQRALGYILGKEGCTCDGMSGLVAEELRLSKREHSKRLKKLLAADKDVSVGRSLSYTVYAASWKGSSVAVKIWAANEDGSDLDAETFARLYTKVSAAASVNSPCITRPYRITWSGKIMMELGKCGMMSWYKRHRSWNLRLKLQLLCKAAMALMEAHDGGFVHCDIRAEKFIVFKEDPDNPENVELKISSLDLEDPEDITGGNVLPVTDEVAWVAPEVLVGKPLSVQSNVYSFGIVIHELISEAQPYGNVPREKILELKKEGHAPWALAENCPKELMTLISDCCSDTPLKRPTSVEIVCQRLTKLLHSYALPKTAPSKKTVKFEELLDAKYNKRIMGFLNQQLQKFQDLDSPLGATQETLSKLESAVKIGERLIDKHRKDVNIQTFYQSVEARTFTEVYVCNPLFDVAREWKMEDKLKVETKVPQAAVDKDREELSQMLEYVLMGNCAGDRDVPNEWKSCREGHLDRMQHLDEVDDEDVNEGVLVGEGGFSAVHECSWNGQRAAVKRLSNVVGKTKIECQADLLKDALIQGALWDQHVPKLIGISKSGWLLMELADGDLSTLCKQNRLKWPSQLGILLQAARRLRYMHSRDPRMVHCDVKSSNFLVFGTDPKTCTIKIADFGLSSAVTMTRCNTARRPEGTPLYVAPELYNNEVLSLASDVYSFGIVMYEVITGRVPFGGVHCNQHSIMKKKLDGVEPCVIEESDCPKDMHELMKECCKVDPQGRPKIADVCRRLTEMKQRYETDETTSRQTVMTEQDGVVPTLQEEGGQEGRVDRGTIDERASRMNISLTLILLQDLRRTFESSEITHEAREGLLMHTVALTEALWEVQKRSSQNELGGCKGALEEMHNRLCSTEVAMKVLKERGSLSLSDASEDISCDLERVQVGISEAIQSLQLVLHAPLQGSGTPGSSYSTMETGISALYSDLMSKFGFPVDVSAEYDRHSASTPEPQRASTGDGDQGTVDSSMQYFRYNRNCMEFLQRQMTEAKKAVLPGHYTKVVKIDDRPEDEESPASCNKEFEHALNLGGALIGRHAKKFDLVNFYTATEAREVTQAICKILKACIEWWNVEGVEILDRVPQDAVEEDEKTLDRYLGCILGTEEESIFEGMPADIQKEWEQAKQEHNNRLRSLKIVMDTDIGPPQHQLSGSVYVATYRGREHAVKSGNRMDNVAFARFYSEAAVMELIRSPSVARLFAVTRSGKLVMEKGEMDIMTWFWQHRSGGLKLKLRLLRDAAQSLSDVHYAGLVHRDIRTKKFVVFGYGLPEVKLVGLGKASTGNITGKNTVRKHGKITFAAPEIFEEKPCDTKSDIYSFGIVMYEMIGETLPYGRGTTDAQVMRMKRNGVEL